MCGGSLLVSPPLRFSCFSRSPLSNIWRQTTDRGCWRRAANLARRTEIVTYCVGVVDESLEEKRKTIQDADGDASAQRRARNALFADEVKVRVTVIACLIFV